MAAESVLLVNLSSDEIVQIQALLSSFDFEIGSKATATFEEAEADCSEEGILLVILHIDAQRRRPDQDIRRLRRRLARPVPLLLLVVPELARNIKEYFRAGADEYWILPLDTAAFPPRLYVLLEWGQSVLGDGGGPAQKPGFKRSRGPSLLRRVLHRIQRVFTSPESTKESASELDARLGTWEKVERLGFGSYGEVWLVKAIDRESLAVAKIPHSSKMNTKFIREAAILKRLLGHPNAVQLKEVIKVGRKIVLIQEYVKGATLQDLFDRGMESRVKERAFLDLTGVLAYAHEQKLMHRDIKPENILLTDSGILKLLDFGTGKDLTRQSISNTVIGSRPFMAPEQIMGKSRLASDVWALGVILYALATESLPFYDDNEKVLMDIILESEPERPRNLAPDLPEAMEAIILKCLQKDWTQRFRNAAELRDALLTRFPDFGQGEILPSS